MSSCQNISHVGLSSLSGTGETLQELTLAYVSPVSLFLIFSNSLKVSILDYLQRLVSLRFRLHLLLPIV